MSIESPVSIRVLAGEAGLALLGEAEGVCPFQSASWLGHWLGAQGGLADFRLVDVEFAGGHWLLPVEQVESHGLRRVRKVGGGHASYFVPPRIGEPAPLTAATLKAVAGALHADALILTDCLTTWAGTTPFAPGFPPAPDIARALALTPDCAKQLYAGETGKKLRAKGRKLESLGALEASFLHGAQAQEALDALMVWKAAQFGTRGIKDAFADAAVRRFLAQGLGPEGPLRLFALRLDARPVAVMVLAQGGGHASGMANGYDPTPEISRCGPGDVLIGRLVEALASEGLAGLDLGVGDARYKRVHCPDVMALNDVLAAATVKGAALVAAYAAGRALKARIKHDAGAFERFKRLRARFLGRSAA